jgi:F-type H+-transporting ATPase subunit alpha
METLAQGRRLQEMLKQPQYKPMPVENQVIMIYAATKRYLLDIEVDDVLRFEGELIEFVQTKYPEVLSSIRETKELNEEMEKKLVQAIEECKKSFK